MKACQHPLAGFLSFRHRQQLGNLGRGEKTGRHESADAGLTRSDAAQNVRYDIKLLRKMERRGLQVIRGEWLVPEVRYYGDKADPNAPKPEAKDRWDELVDDAVMRAHELEEAGLAPWKPR